MNKGRYFEKEVLIATSRDISENKNAEIALAKKIEELKFINSFMIDRELRMIELKKEINELLVKQGDDKKYE